MVVRSIVCIKLENSWKSLWISGEWGYKYYLGHSISLNIILQQVGEFKKPISSKCFLKNKLKYSSNENEFFFSCRVFCQIFLVDCILMRPFFSQSKNCLWYESTRGSTVFSLGGWNYPIIHLDAFTSSDRNRGFVLLYLIMSRFVLQTRNKGHIWSIR